MIGAPAGCLCFECKNSERCKKKQIEILAKIEKIENVLSEKQ